MYNNHKSGMRTLSVLFAACAFALLARQAGATEKIHEALRILVDGKVVQGEADLQSMRFADSAAAMAAFRKSIVSIPRNASVRLTVETINARGKATVVTADPATSYQSLSPARLSVSEDGLVTAAPSSDAQAGTSGDVAVLVVFERGTQQAWNKVFFNILP